MLPPNMQQTFYKAMVVVVSGEIWLVSGLLNDTLMSFASFAPGIDLIYFPAAVRIALILAFGVWGAIGIACFDPILFLHEFGPHPAAQMALTTLTVGFVPLLTITACRRMLGIGPDLRELRLAHLPVIGLATAITTPFALNIELIAENLRGPEALFSKLSAMVMGDFLGCMAALAVIWAVFKVSGRMQRKSQC